MRALLSGEKAYAYKERRKSDHKASYPAQIGQRRLHTQDAVNARPVILKSNMHPLLHKYAHCKHGLLTLL